MKKKKIFMILLLIVIMGGIVFVFTSVNGKSSEKTANSGENSVQVADTNIPEENNNKNDTVNQTANSKKKVRKNTEKVEADTSNMIEINDNFFIQQTNDIYLNVNEYLGKTIKIEGLIFNYDDENGDTCYSVIRNTPGCCGSDGIAGIDIRYNDNYPKKDEWVEVIGVVGKEMSYGSEIPVIKVSSLKVKEKGVTFVTN